MLSKHHSGMCTSNLPEGTSVLPRLPVSNAFANKDAVIELQAMPDPWVCNGSGSY